jgi:hypothetical protein
VFHKGGSQRARGACGKEFKKPGHYYFYPARRGGRFSLSTRALIQFDFQKYVSLTIKRFYWPRVEFTPIMIIAALAFVLFFPQHQMSYILHSRQK